VGTVSGAEESVTDITALGDNVNVAARLASMAAPGEALMARPPTQPAGHISEISSDGSWI
jgi:class 3 adenylate cyclase